MELQLKSRCRGHIEGTERSDASPIRPKRPPPLSPAEYWTYLGAAALCVLLFAIPKPPKGRWKRANQLSSAGFGAVSSSEEPDALQNARAHEPRRGRLAKTPREIPWRGWRTFCGAL